MSPTDEERELDDRFPSGEWTGFYLQPDGRQRYRMDFNLDFAGDRMTGEGTDPVGEFTISGTYDTESGRCSWTKQYIGQHCVEYTGEARERGIIGQWHITGLPESWSGPFFIWPRALGNLEADFERAFVEYEFTRELFADAPLDPIGA